MRFKTFTKRNLKNCLLAVASGLILCNTAHGQSVLSVGINASSDDAEEHIVSGSMDLGSSDLEMVTEADQQVIGLRFNNIGLPVGAVITKAYIQFRADEANSTEVTNLIIKAESTLNPVTFSATDKISTRPLLVDSVRWNTLAAWTVGARSAAQQTPDLKALVQSLISRTGWTKGNSLVFVISGQGKRVADAYDDTQAASEGPAAKAAELIVEYLVPVTLKVGINLATDDMEEYLNGTGIGTFDGESSDLEMTTTKAPETQAIGLRFNNLNIAKGTIITSAKIQFKADEANTEPSMLVIKAVARDNNATFTLADKITTRPLTSDSVKWENIPAWAVDERGANQQTPELKGLVQSVVNRAGWSSGNSLAFVIRGNGKRVADAFDEAGANTIAAELMVEFMGADPANLPAKAPYVIGDFPTVKGSSWKYYQAGDALPANWTNKTYRADTAWSFGSGRIGFGVPGLATTLDETRKMVYLRNTFKTPANINQYDSLIVWASVNDGAVIYLNGIELKRINMPAGVLTPASVALSEVSSPALISSRFVVPNTLLVNDTATFAVALYPGAVSSADIAFDLQIAGKFPSVAPVAMPVRRNALWSVNDFGMDLGTAWKEASYNDGAWVPGVTVLGYGDNPTTTVSFGPDAFNKYPTTYFRKKFNVDPAVLTDSLYLQLRRDDGAVVYLNGTEIIRSNMPAGAIAYNTLASATIAGAHEALYTTYKFPKSLFPAGTNVLAVEIHQDSVTSSDLTFDLELRNKPTANTISSGCTSPADDHITCFTSVNPNGLNQLFNIPTETHCFEMLVEEGDAYNKGTGKVGGGNDFTGYIPDNMTNSTKGHLSINQETTGGVTMLDLHLDATKKLWVVDTLQGIDFSGIAGTSSNCSGGITPWGTVITCEETRGVTDVNNDGYYDRGWSVEIDPKTNKIMEYGTGKPQKLWAAGHASHENVVVAQDSVTMYWGEDNGAGCVYKFIAKNKMNLSEGTLYALKLTSGLVANEPTSSAGIWIGIPNESKMDRNNTYILASNLMATPFNGVEDVEISPIDKKIYFTAKANNRTYRFKDNGTSVTEFETFVGGDSYTFVATGGVTVTEPWASGNDNLTFDDRGNLYVLQDGSKNHLWLVRPDHTQNNPKVEIFATTPITSEPTGMTFSPDFKYMFLSFQHPNTTNTASIVDAAGKAVVFNKSSTVVIARKENLGSDVTTALEDDFSFVPKKVTIYPNPSDGVINIRFGLTQAGAVRYEVLSIEGKVISRISNAYDAGPQLAQLKLEAGMYLIKVTTADGVTAEKVLIK